MANRKTQLTPKDAPVTANELREWRGELGWTQAQAADWLNYSLRAYENWEQGVRSIKRHALMRRQMELAKARRRA